MTQTESSLRQKDKVDDPFISFLERKREDRAMMAALRRGLAQPRCAEVSRVVQCWLSENDPPWKEDSYYTVAPLFGLHHDEVDHATNSNMGTHFRCFCPDPTDPPASVEGRFMRLLASDANDLDDALRQAISLLRSKEVAVNWQQLLRDVGWWKYDAASRDRARLEWSRGFWRGNRQREQAAGQ